MITRACFDIGSGSTKLMIVNYNKNTKQVTELFSELEVVLYGQNWKINGYLDDKIQQQGIDAITKFMEIIKKHQAQQIVGIATEVFRKVKNGIDFIDQLQQRFNFKIKIITQQIEGELGYLTALSITNNNDIISYDSGGSSFQIVTKQDDQTLFYVGDIASSQSHLYCYEIIQNKDLQDSNLSTNPVSKLQSVQLIDYIKTQLKQRPIWTKNKQFIGIGDQFCLFKLVLEIAKKFKYDLKIINKIHKREVIDCIDFILDKQDQELIDLPQYQYAVPKLCLLYSVMDQLDIDNIQYAQSMGSCRGVFIMDSFWE